MPKHPRSSYPSRRDRTYFSNRRARLANAVPDMEPAGGGLGIPPAGGALFSATGGPTNNGGGGSGPGTVVLPSFTPTESGDVTLTHTVSNLGGGAGTLTAWLSLDGSDGSSESTASDRVVVPDLTNSYTFTLVAGVEYTITVGNGGGSSTNLHTVTITST